MSYIPHTDEDRQQMLAEIGVTTIEDLFHAVPASHRFPKLELPDALSEMEIAQEMLAYSEANEHAQDFAIFRGGGAYHHYIPSVVDTIISRGEFLTAYTPYQPEISQGTLQAIYEYQSMMCALTGMEVANASHYDGATSLAEAVTVAGEVVKGKRTKVVMTYGVHPQYREVAETYHQGRDIEFVIGEKDQPIEELVDDETLMVAVQYPNFYGQIEGISDIAEETHDAGAILVVVANPLALGLLKSPGELGADIVVGEGQPLGIPLGYGGPYVGFFATRKKHVRKIAGRIVGETVDEDGKRAYVMTLRPREQDIRRERATSNICTNQGLMALANCVYLALMGKNGLRRVAELNYHKAHYAAEQISELDNFEVDTTKPFFNEFVVKCPIPASDVNDELIANGIVGGLELGKYDNDLLDQMVLCVTEANSKNEIDALVDVLGRISL